MQIEKKTLRNVFVGVAVCILLYWILHETERVNSVFTVLKNIFSPFVLGACFAFILNVPMRFFEKLLKKVTNIKIRRLLAVVLTFCAVLLVLTLVFVLLIPELVATIKSLRVELENFIVEIKTYLTENPQIMDWITTNTGINSFDWSSLIQNVFSVVGNSVSTVVTSTISAIGSITSTAMDIVIGLVFSLYCLFQKETLARQGRKLLYAFFPEKFSDNVVRILRLSNSTFSNFLSGQCVEVCILGAMFAIAMAIFKMPYIPLVSVLVAVTAFIPIVGAWIGCILGAFLILVSNPAQAVVFVVMFLVLQQIENNLIYPRVVGTSIGLSGMWVLVAVSIGGELLGVAGMFLMIPVTSVIQALVREITDKRLASRNIVPEKLMSQPPELASRFKGKTRKSKKEKQKDEVTNTEE